MGIPDHLTCLLRNLYAGQEAEVRTLYGTTDWFKIEKGAQQSCLLLPCLFNLYAEHIMRNARLDKLQAGIKIGGRNINNLRYVDDITLMAESEKSLLMRVKEKGERASLKPNILEVVTDFFLLGSKITVDGACSHEIRCFLLGRKAMTNLDSVLKSRDITLLTKVHIVKTIVFPVVMYDFESRTIKAERGRIDAFELWCWRRLLRVPWTQRRSNQSILKEINPEYLLEVPMLKLKFQYFGHLM